MVNDRLTILLKILLTIISLTLIIYVGKSFFIPITFALIFTLVMMPLHKLLTRWRANNFLASAICVLIILAVVVALGLLIFDQLRNVSNELPISRMAYLAILRRIAQLIESKISPIPYIKTMTEGIVQSLSGTIKTHAFNAATAAASIGLTIIYTFLLLYYQFKIKRFMLMATNKNEHETINESINQIQNLVSNYLVGLLLEFCALFALNALGLYLLGAKYPLLLALIAALFNIIPYIGGLLGSLIPIVVIALTHNSFELVIPVTLLFIINQIIDNYFLQPYVVGSHVNTNPLMAIIAVVIGGMIWGPAGMILFIPLLGIVGIILRHIDGAEPYAYLINDKK